MSKLQLTGSILCMGSINMDLVMFMDHVPGPGETIFTDNFNTYPGGKGGNQAVTAAIMGGNVRFLGKLGGDNFSDQLVQALSSKGVATDSILRDEEATAGIAMIWVDAKGQNYISFTPGANARLTLADIRAHQSLFRPRDILLITMEISPECIYESIRTAKKNGMFIIFDPAPAPREKLPDDIPPLVDIIKPNETEASYISGIEVTDFASAENAVHKMRDMGFAAPVITLGEKGAVALIDGRITRLDPVRVEVVDSTAAGDVFSGALAASLARGSDLRDALDFAGTAAALSTTVRGAQTSIPSLAQVEATLNKRAQST